MCNFFKKLNNCCTCEIDRRMKELHRLEYELNKSKSAIRYQELLIKEKIKEIIEEEDFDNSRDIKIVIKEDELLNEFLLKRKKQIKKGKLLKSGTYHITIELDKSSTS
jgi:hypothetical protein